MPNNFSARPATATLALTAALWLTSALASAQTPAALPTAPGADRAVGTAPATAAKASLAGDNGSPLEPYLFGFIFVGGGLIALLGVKLSDKAVQREHKRFGADGSRNVFGLPVIGERS